MTSSNLGDRTRHIACLLLAAATAIAHSRRNTTMKQSQIANLSFVLVTAMTLLMVPVVSAQADEKPCDAAAKSRYKLEFSGKDSYVVIPELRYDGSHPITLEAHVTPMPRDDKPARSCVLATWSFRGSQSTTSRRPGCFMSTTAERLTAGMRRQGRRTSRN